MDNSKPSLLMRLFQWLFTWKNARRGLLSLVGLITLGAIFYMVENWRGKKAWSDCKRDLVAKGQVMDWSAYIPAPVPDDQNVFKAPKMTEWFAGRGTNELSNRLNVGLQNINPVKVIAADLTLVSKADADTLTINDPAAAQRATELIFSNLAPNTRGPLGDNFFLNSLQAIKPVHLFFQSDHAPTIDEVLKFFPSGFVTKVNSVYEKPRFLIEAASPNMFRLVLNHSCPASDYVTSTDTYETDLDIIREALKRRYARIDGDYTSPFESPIPNFVCLRNTAQLLASRADCFLALNQPDKALKDVLLLHDLCRLVQSGDKSFYVVSSMINVAITGLYVDTITKGLRAHTWQEGQLEKVQDQLKTINLPSDVVGAIQTERAGFCQTIELLQKKSRSQLDLRERCILSVSPKGWLYQNITIYSRLMQEVIDGYSPSSNNFDTVRITKAASDSEAAKSHYSFFTTWAAVALPNFEKALQACANTQSLVNQVRLACALERYYLTQSQYPQTLDDLTPKYLDAIPHDSIQGQSLHYKRTAPDHFLLYSVGWDAKDDGGNPNLDWVW